MKKYIITSVQLNYLFIQLLVILNCLILCGCITEYEAKVDEVADILVVEGIITDDETVITLSRSMNLTGGIWYSSSSLYYPVPSSNYVDNAVVYVECDDGTQWEAEPHDWGWFWTPRNGRYTIKTGTLNPERKYHLKIEIEEMDGDCVYDTWGIISCPTKTYEYSSDYSYPIKTPEIDSIFWRKRDQGHPVMIYVSTQDPQILYYRWSYKEDWEYHAEHQVNWYTCPICDTYVPAELDFCPGCGMRVRYPYQCWGTSNSYGLQIGSAENTVVGKLMDVIVEIAPSSRRLSQLYRINIKQNAISKRSYDYFANIKKNTEQSGNIFAPIPSELRGNITCTTDPTRPVIGYVDVSSTTRNLRYIPRRSNLYEPLRVNYCDLIPKDSLCAWYRDPDNDPPCSIWTPPDIYVLSEKSYNPEESDMYRPIQCVDCTDSSYGGSTVRPEDWPDSY